MCLYFSILIFLLINMTVPNENNKLSHYTTNIKIILLIEIEIQINQLGPSTTIYQKTIAQHKTLFIFFYSTYLSHLTYLFSNTIIKKKPKNHHFKTAYYHPYHYAPRQIVHLLIEKKRTRKTTKQTNNSSPSKL